VPATEAVALSERKRAVRGYGVEINDRDIVSCIVNGGA